VAVAQRGSRVIALLFNRGSKWGWAANATSQLLYFQERDLVAIVEENGWVPGLVCAFCV